MTRDELPLLPADLVEGEYWDRLYGVWAPLDPAGVAELLDGFDRPWWIVGGWAIEAWTGIARAHEDVDVSILACDVPRLREHVGERWQLWNIADGALRPLTDRWPDVAAPDSQIWVRRDASSPWVVDLPLTPDRDGRWTHKRLPEDEPRTVEDATWVADDGIRYLRPELTLLYKAKLDRAKDRRDLELTRPHLAEDQRAWLRDAVHRMEPGHAWFDLLG